MRAGWGDRRALCVLSSGFGLYPHTPHLEPPAEALRRFLIGDLCDGPMVRRAMFVFEIEI